MKITKTYLKQIIKEELSKIEEVTIVNLDPTETNYYNSLLSAVRSGDENAIRKAKDEIRNNRKVNGTKIIQKLNSDFPNQANL